MQWVEKDATGSLALIDRLSPSGGEALGFPPLVSNASVRKNRRRENGWLTGLEPATASTTIVSARKGGVDIMGKSRELSISALLKKFI